MERIRVNIQCPCGALLHSTTVASNSSSIGGTKTCHACKRKCRWQISNGEGFAGYQK